MTPAPPALAVQPRHPSRANRLLRLAAGALVVAVVAVIAGVAAVTLRQQDHIADLEAHDRVIVAVITAPDAQLEVRGLDRVDRVTAISLNSEPMGGSNEPTSNPVLAPTLEG